MKIFDRRPIKEVHPTDLIVSLGGGLVGKTVGDVQADGQINIVMHEGSGVST